MAVRFNTGTWADPIAAISTLPRYQNATVRLEDPSLVVYGEYDRETETTPIISGNPVIYSGRARIIPVRWGVDTVGQNQANSTTISAIRVQIPRRTDGTEYGEGEYNEGTMGGGSGLLSRVKKGTKMFVIACSRTPSLETMVFTCTSDAQGSMSAARTFEFAVDGDAVRSG